MPPQPVLTAQHLSKRYGPQRLFENLSLQLARGEMLALLGESGSGKSTLLNCLAGLEPLDAGQVLIEGRDMAALNEEAQAALRRERLGFVFQAFHVLPHLNVQDNVALPLLLQGRPDPARVAEMLAAVELDRHARHMPRQMSGGQLQRVAIARALVHRPALVLADEPTGNLDARHADQVMQLLRTQLREQGAACLLVTHSQQAAALADRRLQMEALA
ncbi:ABC transporter ATP-binding protein [Pelomonas sp. CA6]|uniref:ABC transporter ATP-binding protein n=1 Tax=Pelomonas sp. CA6 TaxID=2907999 RepID=UPI001F4C3394|nr:ABC transporter ATP-binding protein [Pelomonas sp. CA6]MCH7345347.1 ABC transporter ATP-binding protein [Pelomonas sp. CA6]